jgi:Ser/Thr protein kinase RdoA (MazF antagonist)
VKTLQGGVRRRRGLPRALPRRGPARRPARHPGHRLGLRLRRVRRLGLAGHGAGRGEPLSTLLRREGALSVDRTLDLVAQAAPRCRPRTTAGVVHRDVKPGNLLVRPTAS